MSPRECQVNNVFYMSKGPNSEFEAWLTAEERAVERLADLAKKVAAIDAGRASQMLILARKRTRELLDLREWRDLSD
jgi:hypothetical protein